MPLINEEIPSRYYYLPESNHPNTIDKFKIDGLVDAVTNKSCFLVGLGNSLAAFKILNHVPAEVITEIKYGDIHLMISCELESFIDIVDIIYKTLIIENDIPVNKIILLSGTLDVREEVISVARKYNKEQISTYYFVTGETSIAKGQKLTTTNPVKKKRFLCLNRRWRLHRPFLVGLLQTKKLLDYGHVSLINNIENLNWNTSYQWILNMHKDFPCAETIKLFIDNKQEILNIPDLMLDTNKDDHNTNSRKVMFFLTDKILNLYEETYFSVVTETDYFTTTRSLTEKTFKPIACRHPFIMVASPNTLPMLRQIGYKTFHPYINEAYDTEQNHCIRMKLIVDEVQRLCNLSDNEWGVLNNQLTEIIEHNFNILNNKTTLKDCIHKLI